MLQSVVGVAESAKFGHRRETRSLDNTEVGLLVAGADPGQVRCYYEEWKAELLASENIPG